MLLTFQQLRAALRGDSLNLRHALAHPPKEVFHGLPTIHAPNTVAAFDMAQCTGKDVVYTATLEGIECTSTMDGSGPGYILRTVSTSKDRPYGDAESFALTARAWDLDLQAAFDMAVTGIDFLEWLVVETMPPHVLRVYTPSAQSLAQGRDKLAKCLQTIRQVIDSSTSTEPDQRLILDIPAPRTSNNYHES